MISKKMTGKEFMLHILGGERDFSNVEMEEGFDFDGHPLAEEARKYLICQDWIKYPFVLSGARLHGFKASGLSIPYLKADYITMNKCQILESNFEGGVFYGGKIMNCYFVDDNFRRARFADINARNEAMSIGAAIPGTRILSSDLMAARCHRLKGDSNTKIKHCNAGGIKLNYANISGFDCSGTSMPFADVYCAVLTLACFRNADFTYNDKGKTRSALKNIEYAVGVDMADFSGAKMTASLQEKLQRLKLAAVTMQDDFSKLILYNDGAKVQADNPLSGIKDDEITSILDMLEK